MSASGLPQAASLSTNGKIAYLSLEASTTANLQAFSVSATAGKALGSQAYKPPYQIAIGFSGTTTGSSARAYVYDDTQSSS